MSATPPCAPASSSSSSSCQGVHCGVSIKARGRSIKRTDRAATTADARAGTGDFRSSAETIAAKEFITSSQRGGAAFNSFTSGADMDSSTSPGRQQSLRQLKLLGVALIVAGFSAHATAVPFIGASDDLLRTYAGPGDADLDVVQADVVIDPDAQTITFSVMLKRDIDTGSPRIHVFPSQEFEFKQYSHNVWPRFELSPVNTGVFDFAPDNGDAPVGSAGKRFRFDLVRSAKAADANAQINPPTGPVHTFHLGVWFNAPADAIKAGCPVDVTPFNGEHTAGIQALGSRDFIDVQGPLQNVRP